MTWLRVRLAGGPRHGAEIHVEVPAVPPLVVFDADVYGLRILLGRTVIYEHRPGPRPAPTYDRAASTPHGNGHPPC